MIDTKQAEKIFKKNFIGPEQLKRIAWQLNIPDPFSLGKIPLIKLTEKETKEISATHILILGIPYNIKGKKLTINEMRLFFGFDPGINEPCFYNQDWYLKEKFASQTALKFKWYLINKDILSKTRGKNPQEIIKTFSKQEKFPLAVLAAFAFFAYWFLNNGEKLWKNDFIWCDDKDKNGDRIYAGRYKDQKKINKNGFNIHRHLSLRSCYGAVGAIEVK